MRIVFFVVFFVLIISSCSVKNTGRITSESKNDTIQFTYLYSEALKNKMLGRDELATDQFAQCLRMKPKSSASSYQLALLAYQNEEYGKAKDYVNFSLAIKPENEWYLLLRAGIAKRLNEEEVYTDIYIKLVRKFPNNLDYNYELALIYYDSKKLNESLSILNKLTEQVGINETVLF